MKIKIVFKILVYIFAVIGFVLTLGYFAVRYGLTNTPGIIDTQNEFFRQKPKTLPNASASSETPWAQGEEWEVFKAAAVKDKSVIEGVSAETGVEGRLILASLAVEQLRLFYTEREVFKQVFSPLKILGVQSQFSWGVMGLKQETAIQIEEHLKDPLSPYYLGPEFEHTLDFTTDDHDQERFARLIDAHDRRYSYLYAALEMKQVMKQWENAGFPINDRPEIIATLYNIGFSHSNPNPSPLPGGAEIVIQNKVYSFGGLAAEFYYSDELLKEFPRK